MSDSLGTGADASVLDRDIVKRPATGGGIALI